MKAQAKVEGVWELSTLEDIVSISARVGSAEFVSHWDPDSITSKELLKRLARGKLRVGGGYLYPNDDAALLERLAAAFECDAGQGCVVLPSSTSASLVLLQALKQHGRQHVVFVPPIYYACVRQAELLGLKVDFAPTQNTRYAYDLLDLGARDIIWICNPHYCTGVRLNAETVTWMESQAQRGVFIVIDESMCPQGLGLRFDQTEHIAYLQSPHKVVCSNQVKCGVLLAPVSLVPHARHMADIVAGGVSAECMLAVQEILDSRLLPVQQWFLEQMRLRHALLQAALRGLDRVGIDIEAIGHFVSIFTSSVRLIVPQSRLVSEVANETGMVIIPGSRAYMPDSWGFSFRVNLARCSAGSFEKVACAVEYLRSMVAVHV
jgi:aspartate/methionine/tyrosine aminotransferase